MLNIRIQNVDKVRKEIVRKEIGYILTIDHPFGMEPFLVWNQKFAIRVYTLDKEPSCDVRGRIGLSLSGRLSNSSLCNFPAKTEFLNDGSRYNKKNVIVKKVYLLV